MTVRRRGALAAAWVVVLAAAGLLRFADLGRLCLWYDEVVTVRLARSEDPAALLRRLDRIDATRAPLHPLLLQGWLRVFGPSEAAARAFSAACGVLTVALVGRLGRRSFDDPATGLWAAALAAVSPPLVYYAREARMYAWLVLVTCAAWDALGSLARGATAGRLAWYALTLAALGYSHPLGLLMAAALALASLLGRRSLRLTWPRWLAPHAASALALAPWLPRYFDHPPESVSGPLPWKFLLGTPIGFLGGSFATLAAFAALIGYGLFRQARRDRPRWAAALFLILWLTVPPTLLYVYSRLAHPVFGPQRYTLYVAPAYLILVARGLSALPVAPRLAAGAAALGLAAWALPATVYAPDLKADWRAAADRIDRIDPDRRDPVVVASADPAHNVEVVTARYYLGPHRRVIALPRVADRWPSVVPEGARRVWFAVGLRRAETPVGPLPAAVGRGDAPGSFSTGGLRFSPLER